MTALPGSRRIGRRRIGERRIGGRCIGAGGVGLALAATLALSGCAAGQIAQTAQQKPTIDGTEVTVGSMDLRGLAIEAPPGNSYPAGSSARLKLVIANSGERADVLTSVTSSAIGGWSIYASTVAAASGVGGVRSVRIPAGGRVSFGTPTPTGVLVISGFTTRRFPGTTVRLTFSFTRAGSVSVAVPISLTEGGGSSVIPESSASAAD